MPIIKSAKKRVRVANKAAVRNSKIKRTLRSTIKSFTASLKGEDQRKAQSALDKAVKKGVISKNKASRKKKQLSAKAKAAGTKITKSTTNKTPAKKAPLKKTIAKKAPTKKTTKK